MADGYEYDVFLSAASETPVKEWVSEHFRRLLEVHLGNEMRTRPRIFWWEEQETGVAWPANLQRSHNRSRVLLPVLSPHYFRSAWSMAELQSMLAREEQLGRATEDDPTGLIYPVLFSDGRHFPPDITVRFRKDLSKWRCHWPQYGDTREYVEFDREVREVGKELAMQIERCPPWSSNFPIITEPKTFPEPLAELPRL